MKVALSVLALLITGIILLYYTNSYRSAFEADQACHADQWQQFQDSLGHDCDHDLETKQWLLFERGTEHQAAKVLKRYRY